MNRTNDFIKEVVNTLTTYGTERGWNGDSRTPFERNRYSFGQWILTVESAAPRFHQTKQGTATLSNIATRECYRFSVMVVRDNPNALGYSHYSVRLSA